MTDYSRFSQIIGRRLTLETMITDDAMSATGSGGVQSIALGAFGTGKSTLLATMAEYSVYMVKGSKQSYIHHLVHNLPINKYRTAPTTVIYRARDQDIWPTLIPGNWLERMSGGLRPKPVRVFVHKKDAHTLTLFCYDKKHIPAPIPNLPQVQVYKDADDLIHTIQEGAINIVVEPQTYRLSQRLSTHLQQIRSEYVGKQKKGTDQIDLGNLQKKGRGRPKKATDYSQYAVRPSVFWFDCVNAAMQLWGNRPLQFIFDEGDDFLSSASADAHWWLLTDFAENYRDLRKSNISTVISTHLFQMLTDRIVNRATHKIMLPGIKASKNSMIKYTEIFSQLPMGQYIIEKSNREFGIDKFGRIPNTIMCKIDGLQNNFKALTDKETRMIRKQYQESWGIDPLPAMTVSQEKSAEGVMIV